MHPFRAAVAPRAQTTSNVHSSEPEGGDDCALGGHPTRVDAAAAQLASQHCAQRCPRRGERRRGGRRARHGRAHAQRRFRLSTVRHRGPRPDLLQNARLRMPPAARRRSAAAADRHPTHPRRTAAAAQTVAAARATRQHRSRRAAAWQVGGLSPGRNAVEVAPRGRLER
jgi:hypothetical protein